MIFGRNSEGKVQKINYCLIFTDVTSAKKDIDMMAFVYTIAHVMTIACHSSKTH